MCAYFEWRDCAFECRLLYIKCPLKSHKLCTIRKARVATLGCAFLCALATIPFLLEHMVVPTPAHEDDGGPGTTMPSAAYAEAGTTYEYTSMAAAVNENVNVSAEGGSTEHEAMYSIDMRSMQPDAGGFARFLGKLVFWMQAMVNKILPTALLCALSVFLVVSMRNAERRRQLLRAPKTSASNLLQTARAKSVLNPPVLEVQEPTVIEAPENGFGCNGRLDGMGPPGRLAEASSTALRSEANGDAYLPAAPPLTPPSMSYAQSSQSQSQSQVDCAVGEASYVERDEDSNVNALTLTAFPFRVAAPPVSFSSAAKAASSTAAGKIIKRNGSHCQSVSGNILDHRCRRTSRTTHLLLAICVIYIIDYIPQVGHLFGTLRTVPILV